LNLFLVLFVFCLFSFFVKIQITEQKTNFLFSLFSIAIFVLKELNEARKSAMALMAAEEAKTESVASSSVTVELKPFQTKFIQFALDATVLRFGEFTLKSGRTR
tara:strand:+ start:1924 stop:2235 length:312 start_codon:yes stop_codon:yes gene_type:complete